MSICVHVVQKGTCPHERTLHCVAVPLGHFLSLVTLLCFQLQYLLSQFSNTGDAALLIVGFAVVAPIRYLPDGSVLGHVFLVFGCIASVRTSYEAMTDR